MCSVAMYAVVMELAADTPVLGLH